MKRTILVVDDREDLLDLCARKLGDDFSFLHAWNPREAATLLKDRRDIVLVLLDRDFTRADPATLIGPESEVRHEGLHVLRWLRQAYPLLPVLMVSAYREQQSALAAADLRTDYIVWEDVADDPAILPARVRGILGPDREEVERVLGAFHEHGLVGRAPRFAEALFAAYRALASGRPILLLGETGTGKDLLAAAVHALSGNGSRPFVSVNVAALNPHLIESELFGHAQGAFANAIRDRVGRLRMADGGTLFLNEIADLPLDLQPKLLSAVEKPEVEPVGSDRAFPARFRLITATSQNLKGLVAEGRFREDLYHRLAWNTVEIPPLRERREDVPLLVQYFLGREARYGEGITKMTEEAIEFLCTLDWEGNVRRLQAVVEASSLHAEQVITLLDVRGALARTDPTGRAAGLRRGRVVPVAGGGSMEGRFEDPASPCDAPPGAGRPSDLEAEDIVLGGATYRELTAKYVHYLYRRTKGNVPELARIARISKATAYAWVKRFVRGSLEDEAGGEMGEGG